MCISTFLVFSTNTITLAKRKRKEGLRTVGMRGIGKHQIKFPPSLLGGSRQAWLSSIFSFLMLLYPLFLPLPDRPYSHRTISYKYVHFFWRNMCTHLLPSSLNKSWYKRKRKEDLRTIGMGGIRNALSQIYISHAREEIKALHSFMFPLLMLLGHLFLPLPCSQFFFWVGWGCYKLLPWNTMPQVYIETFCYLY